MGVRHADAFRQCHHGTRRSWDTRFCAAHFCAAHLRRHAGFRTGADVKACSGADVNAAIPACTRLLALSMPMQQRGAAYGFRARAYYLKGEYDHAIHDFDDALRLNPKDVASYGLRGAAYLGKGDFDAAIRDLNDAIRLNPRIVRDYLNEAPRTAAREISTVRSAISKKPSGSRQRISPLS